MSEQEQKQAQNTDKELWRERPGDFYSDSIHVTRQGEIAIDCGGTVFVRKIRDWHKLAAEAWKAQVLKEQK